MKRSLPLLLLAALLGIGALSYWGWQRVSARREWDLNRPPLPPLAGTSTPGLDERLATYHRRLEQWPPDTDALADFTRVCHANGQLDAAVTGYRTLIKLNPDEPRWHYRLASILAGFGRLDEALPHLRGTVELAPDYTTARLKLGEALLKSNDIVEAETVYREVLDREPDNKYAILGVARCDLQGGRLTSARSHLQRAVVAHPHFSSAQSLLGTVLERLGNSEGAELARAKVQQGGHYAEPADPWLSELINDCHDPYTFLTAASAAVTEGRLQDALPHLKRGLDLAPENARLHRQLAKTHAALGDQSTARAAMEKAVELEPTNDAIHLDLLALIRKTNDSAALASAVARGVAHCPGSAALQFEAGLLAAQSGRFGEAARFFETAWRNQPDQTAAAYEAATAHFRQAEPERAVALLEQVLTRHPNETPAAIMLARYGIQSADSRAAHWLNRAIATNPPPAALAELREGFRRRFGVVP